MAPRPLFQNQKNPSHEDHRILESYLTDRLFQVKFKDKMTTLRKTEAGIPQGSAFGPGLYLTYTSDLPTSDKTTTTFADDAAILVIASMTLQATINKIND
jgi:hypothetical protein